jgi:hypothetical protein
MGRPLGRGRTRPAPIEPGKPQTLGVVSQGVRNRGAVARAGQPRDAASFVGSASASRSRRSNAEAEHERSAKPLN